MHYINKKPIQVLWSFNFRFACCVIPVESVSLSPNETSAAFSLETHKNPASMKPSTTLERAIYVHMKYSSPRARFLFHLYGRICCVNHLETNKLYNQHFKAKWNHGLSSFPFTNQRRSYLIPFLHCRKTSASLNCDYEVSWTTGEGRYCRSQKEI